MTKNHFSIIAVFSILFTFFGFYLDTDLPNEKVTTTVFEIVMMILITFIIITSFYFASVLIMKKIKK